MKDFAAVIDAFGSPVTFGAAVGIPDSHARTMKARNSIPSEYWPDVVRAAAEKNVEGITFEALAGLAAKRRPARGATA